MKTISIFFAAAIAAASVSGSCNEPSERKVERSGERVEEAKEELREAELKYAEEWGQFKAEAQRRMMDNENELYKYRERTRTDNAFRDRYDKRITELEEKNEALRRRLDAYDRENREVRMSKWEQFRTEFNHDMDEMGNSLKGFGKDDVK